MGNPRMPVVVDTGSSTFPATTPPKATSVGKKAAGKRPTTVDPMKSFGGKQASPGSKKVKPQRG